MRVPVGRIDEVPEAHCAAAADGAAVVVRFGGQVVAFPNRCLHQDSALAGGLVLGGALICPMHFWRYRLPDGTHTGGRGSLRSYPTEVTEDGDVYVEVPDPAPVMSVRELLLAHARSWERDRQGKPGEEESQCSGAPTES